MRRSTRNPKRVGWNRSTGRSQWGITHGQGDLARTALTEFSDDRELTELERVTEGALERAAQAEEWLQRGQQLCFDRQFGEGLEALRRATSLDDRNAVIRAALLNALVEQARSVLGQDWRAAEPLIQQALNIDGGHPLAKSLQGLVFDYKRQEVLNDSVSQAREMQANGNLEGALAKVEEALASYPNEVRLVQLRATLRDLSGSPVAAPGKPEGTRAGGSAAEMRPSELETLSVGSPAVGHSAFGIDRGLACAAAPPGSRASSNPERASASIRAALRARAGRFSASAGRMVRDLAKVLQGWAEPKGHFSKLQWGLVGAAPVILAMALTVMYSRVKPTAVAPPVVVLPTEYLVDLGSNVASAKYRVDGNPIDSTSLRLPPGPHTVEAFLPGYKSLAQQFTLAPGVGKLFVVSMKLEPEPVRLRLSSGLKSGQVILDDQAPTNLQEGRLANDEISLSMDHTFLLTQEGKESLAFSFRAEPGGMVQLTSPINARDVTAIVISALGSGARVYASNSNVKGGLKDSTPHEIPQEGLELGGITGAAELTLAEGKSRRTIPIDTGNAPTLTITLTNDPGLGTLRVEVRPPDAEIWRDGRKLRPLRAGTNHLEMEPGKHKIRVTKDGFEPLERTVELKKGETVPLGLIELRPVVRTASLSVEGATRDAEVLIDGTRRGTVAGDGTFRLDGVPPGMRSIALRKAEFEEKQISRVFAVGQTVHISGADAQLTSFGSLRFHVLPLGTSIGFRRTEETQSGAGENGKVVPLRAGRYVVTATAAGFRQHQETVTVEPGKPYPIDWTLLPEDTKKGVPPPSPSPSPSTKQTVTRDHFRDPEAWTEEGTWWVHKGQAASLLRRNQGVYLFDFQRQRGGITRRTRRVEWVIDQKDPGNRIEYSFDFGSLERRVVQNGKARTTTKVKVPPGSGDQYTLQIEIAPAQIVVRDGTGKALDRYDRPNRADQLGMFGFKGDVALVLRKAEER